MPFFCVFLNRKDYKKIKIKNTISHLGTQKQKLVLLIVLKHCFSDRLGGIFSHADVERASSPKFTFGPGSHWLKQNSALTSAAGLEHFSK